MNKTELNKYVRDCRSQGETFCLEHDTYTVTLKQLSLSSVAAIANKIASEVVTDSGEYRPCLKEPLLIFYILMESGGIRFAEFHAEEMFTLLNSPLGHALSGLSGSLPWLKRLCGLVDEKVDYRKSIYTASNSPVNHKLSVLVDKEISVQNALYDSLKYMQDFSMNISPEEMKHVLGQVKEFTEMMKKPELSDRFVETIQRNAQDERIGEADRIIRMNKGGE